MKIEEIQQVVQRNCDIVDANHAQDYGLCVYLLRMRDHYRWKKEIALSEEIVNEEIREWILDTEALWDQIQEEPFAEITLGDRRYDPFDADLINDQLLSAGYVYGGGLGYGGVPLFLLAEIERIEERFGFEVLITKKEIARGVWGAPALTKGNRIIVRREALKQLLWSRYDEWGFKKLDNPMKQALESYPFEKDPETAVAQMAEVELETLIQHEIGEGLIGKEFGGVWREMLGAFLHTRTEHVLRAIKDLAADCMTTLPYLIRDERAPSLHLYFALYSDMRKELFPALYCAYQNWSKTGSIGQLNRLVEKGKIYWFDKGKELLELYSQGSAEIQPYIEALLKENLEDI